MMGLFCLQSIIIMKGENDYYFLLDMFNKRTNISEKQESKIRAVIVSSIRPYLIRKLSDKIK